MLEIKLILLFILMSTKYGLRLMACFLIFTISLAIINEYPSVGEKYISILENKK